MLSDPRGGLGRAPPEGVREVFVKAIAAKPQHVVGKPIQAWCFVRRGGKHCLFEGVWAQGKRKEAVRFGIHLSWEGLKTAQQAEGLGVAASRLQVAVDGSLEGTEAVWPVRTLKAQSFGAEEGGGEAARRWVDMFKAALTRSGEAGGTSGVGQGPPGVLDGLPDGAPGEALIVEGRGTAAAHGRRGPDKGV